MQTNKLFLVVYNNHLMVFILLLLTQVEMAHLWLIQFIYRIWPVIIIIKHQRKLVGPVDVWIIKKKVKKMKKVRIKFLNRWHVKKLKKKERKKWIKGGRMESPMDRAANGTYSGWIDVGPELVFYDLDPNLSPNPIEIMNMISNLDPT